MSTDSLEINPPKYLAQKRWRDSHKEYNRDRLIAWRKKNRAKYNETRRLQYHNLSPEKKKKRCERVMRWHRKNPGYASASRDKRQRAKSLTRREDVQMIERWIKSVKSKPFAICYYCKRTRSTMDIHFDHVVPLSKGGAHNVGNMCIACISCNCAKGANRISEWTRIPTPLLDL